MSHIVIYNQEAHRGGGGGGNLVFLSIEEEAMWMMIVYYRICDFPRRCHGFEPTSCHLSPIHMSILPFQGHSACSTEKCKILICIQRL